MDRQVWFRWDEVPDRPDGQVDEASLKKEADGLDGPQSNLKLGTLYIGDRDFEIRLERLDCAHFELIDPADPAYRVLRAAL